MSVYTSRAIAAAFLCAICFGCTSRNTEVAPSTILNEERFAAILTDVRLLEGVYAGDFQRIDTSSQTIGAHYEQLFVKHQTNRTTFLESNEYYATHPEIMLRIETEVSRKLEGMSATQLQ